MNNSIVCILLSIIIGPAIRLTSGSQSEIRQLQEVKVAEDNADWYRRAFMVTLVIAILLLVSLILTYRIARTYKLSLMACESKLQALIIHTKDNSPKYHSYHYRHSPLIPRNRLYTNEYSAPTRYNHRKSTPERLRRTHHSEPTIQPRKSSLNIGYDNDHNHAGSMSNHSFEQEIDELEAMHNNENSKRFSGINEETVTRRGSIWQTVGDYVIHVKENGEIESHALNKDDKQKIVKKGIIQRGQQQVQNLDKNRNTHGTNDIELAMEKDGDEIGNKFEENASKIDTPEKFANMKKTSLEYNELRSNTSSMPSSHSIM